MKHRLVLLFAAASTLSVGAIAQSSVTVQVTPPVTVVETVPAPAAWAPPHWVQSPDGTWRLVGGAFVQPGEAVAIALARDRDRDGTPDHLDDDKDNDGVPNRYDSHPNNRWRD